MVEHGRIGHGHGIGYPDGDVVKACEHVSVF